MDEDVVLVERVESSVISTQRDDVVSVVIVEPTVITDEMQSVVAVEQKELGVVATGQQGPPGPQGISGGGDVFIVDVIPTAVGIVGSKVFVVGSTELISCATDTLYVRVGVECEGRSNRYLPSVLVNGVAATLVESSTKRWFTGYADITLPSGASTITAVSDTDLSDTAEVVVVGAGPIIPTITFGAYPGTQTELKAGDQIDVTITTELEAVSVTVLATGAVTGGTFPVTAGVATGTLTVAGTSGAQSVTAKAENSFGTFGPNFVSTTLTLSQVYPTIGSFTAAYPGAQGALGTGEAGTVSSTITNADTVTYTSPDLTITDPSTYAATKDVTNTATGYINSATNYTVVANRAANDATSTAATLVKIATVAPTAAITVVPSGRLTSSPTGVTYDVRITPNQVLASAPSLTASLGSWSGSWTLSGSYWHRSLVINDGVARGAGSFSSLVCPGLSGLAGNTITGGSSYTVGGFSPRSVTFPAFSRVAPLGVAVADATKVSVTVGATSLTRHTDAGVYANGFYPANTDGTYNATGTYIGLSDTAFAGANTTGTLVAIVQEVA